MRLGTKPEPLRQAASFGAAASGTNASRPPSLQPLNFADLCGFADADHREALALFAQHAAAILSDRPVLRQAQPASAALRAICRRALEHPAQTQAEARAFFETFFVPHRVLPQGESGPAEGFLTGYYEPVTAGSLTETAIFRAPILGRPDDLVTLAPGETFPGFEPSLSAARLLPDGSLSAYPDRAAIESGALESHATPLVFLADPVEVFFAQVQCSARITLPAGRGLRLTYAGRNGHPYTSIGRILVESGEIAADSIGLKSVKAWIRAHGQKPGEAGRDLMWANKSYVFFSSNSDLSIDDGPIGGAGLSLVPLRSIAIDRSLWSYGLPFWLSAELPWQSASLSPFRKLMIASDTGSAILGAARADIFFGSGAEAGACAGSIRHVCGFIVLLPRESEEDISLP